MIGRSFIILSCIITLFVWGTRLWDRILFSDRFWYCILYFDLFEYFLLLRLLYDDT